MRLTGVAAILLVATFPAACTISDFSHMTQSVRNAAPSPQTREALYHTLDVYLDALEKRDPTSVPWADEVFNTEDNVAMNVGEGLWETITGLGDYQLRFADVKTGQVGYFGAVEETNETSAFSLRLKIDRDGRISEVETLVVRISFSGLDVFADKRFWEKPVFNETVSPDRRIERERLISIADGYFETLQRNNGELFTKIHPECNRVENGVQSTNNKEFADAANYPIAALGCEAQFRLGQYKYDDELRARRFPLVDEERGLVLAAGFIDHSGRLGEYELTDGTTVVSPFRRPHSFYLLELFKIEDGAIRQIEANFITVPYKMPSPWDDR